MKTPRARADERDGGGASPAGGARGTHSADDLENYAGGYIQAHHGKINGWLVVVIVVLIVWAIYYGFTYWGGLGDSLDY